MRNVYFVNNVIYSIFVHFYLFRLVGWDPLR